MDKKKIRKSLSKAHKVIEPLTDKLSHRDIKHVNDGMICVNTALKKASTSAPNDFAEQEHLTKNNGDWVQTSGNNVSRVTTNRMMKIIENAKKYIKSNF